MNGLRLHSYPNSQLQRSRVGPIIEAECRQPSVIARDISSRPRPKGHVIVFANVKGGVGKSTLAFQCCVALCGRGYKVAAIDLDRYQHSLASALTYREATARILGAALPCPRHAVLERPSGAHLSQEIARLGSECDIVIIDVAGHDSTIARYAIAMADTLVTPINNSFVDLSVLARFDPATMQMREPARFGKLIIELNAERSHHRLGTPDWLVVKNRTRAVEVNQERRIDDALASLASQFGFRIGNGLSERVAYRELFLFGLTHLDLELIPGLPSRRNSSHELSRCLDEMNLPVASGSRLRTPSRRAKTRSKSSETYRRSIEALLPGNGRATER